MKREQTLKILHSRRLLLGVTIFTFIVLFFYFIYFQGEISEKYNVYTSKTDDVRKITTSESMEITIKKPFDEFYIPLVSINVQELEVQIEIEGIDAKEKIILKIPPNDYHNKAIDEESYQKFFFDNVQYFFVDGFELSKKDVPRKCTFTVKIDCDDGFVLMGTCGEELSYQIMKNTKVNYWIYFYVVIVGIAGTLVIIIMMEKNVDTIKRYTVMVVFLGGIYFVLLPPSCTNDSITHIMSIYNRVSDFVGHSDWLNIDGDSAYSLYQSGDGYVIRECLRDSERKSANPNTKMYDEEFYVMLMKFPNDGTIRSGYQLDLYNYSNIVYLPYYIVMILGRILNINLMLTLQVARILGFLFFVIMVRYAIKLMPYGKEALAIFSLTPMMLQSMVAISYDLFCIGGSFIAFAYVLKINTEEHRYTWKDVALICFLTIVLISVKYGVYFACFVFLYFFLIGLPKIIKRTKYLVCLALPMVLICGLAVIKFDSIKELVLAGNTDVYYSVVDIIENPLGMIRFIGVSIISDLDKVIRGMFGGRLGWDEEITPWVSIIVFIILFTLACTFDKDKYEKKERIYSLVTIILFVLGMYVIFLRGTERKRSLIYGLQGRYFIPLIPLVICFMNNHKLKLNCKPNLLFNSLWFVSIIHIFFAMTVYLRR